MKDIAFRSYERFSQAEFATWLQGLPPGDLHRYELLNGFIVREPPAGWPHGEVAAEILRQLATFVRTHRLGRVFDSSQGFDLPSGDTVEPDVSFVSNARWGASKPERGFLRVVPDLVFEVLSPSTARLDRGDKRRIYAANGVREYVLVDEAQRTVERFASGGRGFDEGRRFDGAQRFESLTLPGFGFVADSVFPVD